MASEIGIKLLKLTRAKGGVSISELQKELRLTEEELRNLLARLRDEDFLSFSAEAAEQNSAQRLLMAEALIRNGLDSQVVSKQLLWQEFEEFIEVALYRNAYTAKKHVVFTGPLGRREVDVMAWNDVWILVIDCKHWSRNLTTARLRYAAEAQAQRASALAAKPRTLIMQGIRRLDLPLVPLVICLGESRERVIDGIPIVAVSEFASFLHEASPYDPSIKTFTVGRQPAQRTLASMLSNLKHDRRPNLAQATDRRRP
jgi:hypothetical protein